MKQDSLEVMKGTLHTEIPVLYSPIEVRLPVGKGGQRFQIALERLADYWAYLMGKMKSEGIMATPAEIVHMDKPDQAYLHFFAFFPTTKNQTDMKMNMIRHAQVKDIKLDFA